MTQLRKKMIEDMTLKGLSIKTQKAYLLQVRLLSKYFNKSPDLLSKEELRQYFLYLIQVKKLSSSMISSALCGIKFLYTNTLKKNWTHLEISYPRKRRKIPIVLSKEEVKNILDSIRNLKHRTIIMTIYSASLRVSEASKLKICDIDSKRMTIHVKQFKFNKDRYTILGEITLKELRKYWKEYKPKNWLFEGYLLTKPISERSIEKILSAACKKQQ